jgi:hypothetical protein
MDASPKTTFSARRGSIFAFLGLAPLSGLLTLVSALDIPPQISPWPYGRGDALKIVKEAMGERCRRGAKK